MPTIDLLRWVKSSRFDQSFWGLMLLLGVGDRATRIRYRPGRDRLELSFEVGGVEYEMIPPPRLLAPELLRTLVAMLHPRSGWKKFITWVFRPPPELVSTKGLVGLTLERRTHAMEVKVDGDSMYAEIGLPLHQGILTHSLSEEEIGDLGYDVTMKMESEAWERMKRLG
jgi:hypothetical protein